MQVILVKPVRKLGNIMDIVEVAGGYARNYLLPYNYAIRMTKKNLQLAKQNIARLEQENAHKITLAQEVIGKIKNIYVTFIRKAIDSHSSCDDPYSIRIFGSVNEKDVISSLDIISEVKADTYISSPPIKTIGVYGVAVNFHPQLPPCTVYVNVARSEADAQLYERIHRQIVLLHPGDEERIKHEWLLKLQGDTKGRSPLKETNTYNSTKEKTKTEK